MFTDMDDKRSYLIAAQRISAEFEDLITLLGAKVYMGAKGTSKQEGGFFLTSMVVLEKDKKVLCIRQVLNEPVPETDNGMDLGNSGWHYVTLNHCIEAKRAFEQLYEGYEFVPVYHVLDHSGENIYANRKTIAGVVLCYGQGFFDEYFPEHSEEAWNIFEDLLTAILKGDYFEKNVTEKDLRRIFGIRTQKAFFPDLLDAAKAADKKETD